MHVDTLLGMLSFSVKETATIFQYSRQIPPELRTKLSPALADTVDTCAKLLGVSPPTLYKSKKNSWIRAPPKKFFGSNSTQNK